MKHLAYFGDEAVEIELDPLQNPMQVLFDGAKRDIEILRHNGDHIVLKIDHSVYDLLLSPAQNGFLVNYAGRTSGVAVSDARKQKLRERLPKNQAQKHAAEIHAAMPGIVLKTLVKAGDSVTKNSPMLVIEAMKMENEILAHGDVKIAKIHVSPGDAVDKNALLITLAA